MEPKSFIETNYFELPEVYALNSFLTELPKSNIQPSMAEEIFELSRLHPPLEKLDKYVPGSESYNRIVEEHRLYFEAQEVLKEYKYSKEHLLDECYPNYLNLYRHTVTVICNEYDYETDSEYTTEKTLFFYSSGFFNHEIVYNPQKLVLPYVNKERAYSSEQDLIGDYIRKAHHIMSELSIYKRCAQKGWDPDVFKSTFGIDNVEIYSYMYGDNLEIVDTDTNKKYTEREAVKLMEDYKVAKTKRYIREEKYVEYPHCTYLKFLEKLGAEYVEDTVNS